VEQPATSQNQLRHLRHNLRGRLNALKLCVSALEILVDPKEELEFLDMIQQAADAAVASMDELEAHPEYGAAIAD
jgi:hypothetical protein